MYFNIFKCTQLHIIKLYFHSSIECKYFKIYILSQNSSIKAQVRFFLWNIHNFILFENTHQILFYYFITDNMAIAFRFL